MLTHSMEARQGISRTIKICETKVDQLMLTHNIEVRQGTEPNITICETKGGSVNVNTQHRSQARYITKHNNL